MTPDFTITTQQVLVAQITELAKLTRRQQGDDLMQCTVEELQQLAIDYRDAQQDELPSWFDNFLRVMQMIVQVVQPLSTVASAITTVFGTVSAAKGL